MKKTGCIDGKHFDIVDMLSESEIQARIKTLANEINNTLPPDGDLLCICVLKGAFMFFTDLVRELRRDDMALDFMTLSSYENQVTSMGNIKLITNIREEIKGRDVIIVEDIVDSGLTLSYLKKYFEDKQANSVKIACLIDKKANRKTNDAPDFSAFTMDTDEFIIGYGMDFSQHYRNLPGVYKVIFK